MAPRNRRLVVAAALQRLDLVDYAASVVHLTPRPEGNPPYHCAATTIDPC